MDLLGADSFPQIDGDGLRAWLGRLTGGLAPDSVSFAVRLVDDDEMRRLNRSYRNRDATTDVLSFPGDETPEGRHLGDVVVSVPAAARQARREGHSLTTELRILLLHGALHCLGFDHETDEGEMERRERQLRRCWIEGDGGAAAPPRSSE